MKMRKLGRTGYQISEIGFGAWAIGSSWGEVSEGAALGALNAAIDSGVNFIDTADVYGDGRSERLIAQIKKERSDAELIVATKAGRRLNPHTVDGYNLQNLEAFIDRSRANLEMDSLDLVQLHCPPTEAYYRPEVFGALDSLVGKGKIKAYGVSVERVEEALKAIEFPGVASVQIIFNAFRHRPAERFFNLAEAAGVAIIARVPLASGLLSGKLSADSQFAVDDHRSFNRHGEAFDVGETFSGVPYEVGLKAVEELRAMVPKGVTMAQWALAWILSFDAVSVVIPGAKSATQASDNAAASAIAPLPHNTMEAVADVYNRLIRRHVHQRW
jgi:aryl-alcohol dehydrogenase-like predicted oxidoreductase